MKISTFVQIVLLSIGGIACGDAAMNTTSKPANTARANAMNTATTDTATTNTEASKTTSAPVANTTAPSASANTMKPANTMALPTNAKPHANGTTGLPPPQPTPPPTAEKKDEGLFSFPPPKVISYSLVNNSDLLNKDGQTTFSQVSGKLAAGLKKAGYDTDDKYAYFWNEKDEFAIVTAMERINPDGTPIVGDGRWDSSTQLPRAHTWSEYIKYLMSGKKIYYRVFAFIVTAKRAGHSFNKGSSPDFRMASEWKKKGDSALGEGESTAIGDVIFTEKYKCYALLYLFVNHTRLDSPQSIDTLKENDQGLTEGVNQAAGDHLRQTGIKFGE